MNQILMITLPTPDTKRLQKSLDHLQNELEGTPLDLRNGFDPGDDDDDPETFLHELFYHFLFDGAEMPEKADLAAAAIKSAGYEMTIDRSAQGITHIFGR